MISSTVVRKVWFSNSSRAVLFEYMSSGKIMGSCLSLDKENSYWCYLIFLASYLILGNELLSKTYIRFIIILSSMSFRKYSNLNGNHNILVKPIFLMLSLILSCFLYMNSLIAWVFFLSKEYHIHRNVGINSLISFIVP